MHGDHRVNRLKLHELQVLLAVAQAGSRRRPEFFRSLGTDPAVDVPRLLQPPSRDYGQMV